MPKQGMGGAAMSPEAAPQGPMEGNGEAVDLAAPMT